jgi:hypothetical protein
MRGNDNQQLGVFSYVNPEQRVPQDHPLRPLRAMADEALRDLRHRFRKIYAKTGRPSIAPERLLRALLLQVLYSVRSERMLMEQLDYNLGKTNIRRSPPVKLCEDRRFAYRQQDRKSRKPCHAPSLPTASESVNRPLQWPQASGLRFGGLTVNKFLITLGFVFQDRKMI